MLGAVQGYLVSHGVEPSVVADRSSPAVDVALFEPLELDRQSRISRRSQELPPPTSAHAPHPAAALPAARGWHGWAAPGGRTMARQRGIRLTHAPQSSRASRDAVAPRSDQRRSWRAAGHVPGRLGGDPAEPPPVAHQGAELPECVPQPLVRGPGERTGGPGAPVGAELVPGVTEADPHRRPRGCVVPGAAPLLDQASAELELHPLAVDDHGGRPDGPQPQVVGHHPQLEVRHLARLDQHRRDEVAGFHGGNAHPEEPGPSRASCRVVASPAAAIPPVQARVAALSEDRARRLAERDFAAE